VRLKSRLSPILELESGSNDPMAVFLTIALTSLALSPSDGWTGYAVHFVVEMVLGAALGIAFGLGWAKLINRLRLEYDGLYPVLTLALVMTAFGFTSLVGGNGFLAVYAAGVALGSRNFVHRLALIQFHDGVAWLMQIAMFLTLGLLVFPSNLLPVAWTGLALALVLLFVARPAAVFLSLIGSRMPVREKAFLSWVGLRGAVPIVLATIPVTMGLPGSQAFFNVVFFVVVVSVMLQGTTIPWVARLLNVGVAPGEDAEEVRVPQSTIELVLRAESPVVGRLVVDLKLPPSALLLLLHRDGESYIPRGSTALRAGDGLLVATRKDDAEDLRRMIEG
jgi:cell volume regulation protein A